MSTVLYCSLSRGTRTEICDTLFSDNNIDIMFSMIDMGNHRNETRDLTITGSRRSG